MMYSIWQFSYYHLSSDRSGPKPCTDLAPKSSLSAQLWPEVTARLTHVPPFRHQDSLQKPQRYLLLFTNRLGSSALISRYGFVKYLTSEQLGNNYTVTAKPQAPHRIFKKCSTRDECGMGRADLQAELNLELPASSNRF